MKQSESKRLDGYNYPRCIALVPSLLLLAGFVVQGLLIVLPCRLTGTEEEVLRNTTALGTSSKLYINIWVSEAEGTNDVP